MNVVFLLVQMVLWEFKEVNNMAFAKDLRASVLQAAMQGKLTEQLEMGVTL